MYCHFLAVLAGSSQGFLLMWRINVAALGTQTIRYEQYRALPLAFQGTILNHALLAFPICLCFVRTDYDLHMPPVTSE